MFLKLVMNCVEIWGSDLSKTAHSLDKFSDKYNILRSAKVDFPGREMYDKGLDHIVGGFSSLELSQCYFPGNAEDTVNTSKLDESSFVRVEGTSSDLNNQVLSGLNFTKTRYNVDSQIQEVLPSEEYSAIDHVDEREEGGIELKGMESNFGAGERNLKVEELIKYNGVLLKDMEDMGVENERLLGRVKKMVDYEGKISKELVQCRKEKDELRERVRILETGVENRTDVVSSRVEKSCEECKRMREENKELKRKVLVSSKEIEFLTIRNEELMRQLKMDVIREHSRMEGSVDYNDESMKNAENDHLEASISRIPKPSHNQTSKERSNYDYVSKLGTPIDLSDIEGGQSHQKSNSKLKYYGEDVRNGHKDSRGSLDDSERGGMRSYPDIKETLNSLKDSKNRLEDVSTKLFNGSKMTNERNQKGDDNNNKNEYGRNRNDDHLKAHIEMPKKKDFSTPDSSAYKVRQSAYQRKDQNGEEGVLKFLKEGLGRDREEEKNKGYEWSRHSKTPVILNTEDSDSIYQKKGKKEEPSGKKTIEQNPITFKNLSDWDSILKYDIHSTKARREERLPGLQNYLKADDPSAPKYKLKGEEQYQRETRKSLGSSSHSRYLEKVSKLYTDRAEQDSYSYGYGAPPSNDHSFTSTAKRMSSSLERSANHMVNTDAFLKQINDRVNSLVTK